MQKRHVIVIGAGSTGCAITHDLALRDLEVTLLERGAVASGTTGHNHGQFHSGARYVVNDPEAARECIAENRILRRLMPEVLELNDGLFIGVDDNQTAFRRTFLEACAACGVPAEEISPAEALRLEPRLHPQLRVAVRLPDGSFDPTDFCLSFVATAQANGAQVQTDSEVVGLEIPRRQVKVRRKQTNQEEILTADLIINAAGPWAGRIAAMGGIDVQVEPSAGVIVILGERACNMVISLMGMPGDGDIIVPLRDTIMLGTTSWRVDDPDSIPIPPEHVELLLDIAGKMIPDVRHLPVRRVIASARPLLVIPGQSGRSATRGFAIFDHQAQGFDGLISVVGGKTITARLMAEEVSDAACARLGMDAPCRTREVPLLPPRAAAPLKTA
jgi:glycerol-3-phosphate dehydrogenase